MVSAARSVKAIRASLPSGDHGPRLAREDHHHPDRVLVIGNRAGQHRPQASLDRRRREQWPAVLALQIVRVGHGLFLEGIDAGPLTMLDLQSLEVMDAPIGDCNVAQELIRVDQHKPGPVDGKQSVGGLDDTAQRLVEVAC
jgi:hypothetical protein